ncbi:hypothetical protein IBX73_02445 [candidate division WOR-3 bacterium]|nr:hypothetical protein [candidate division WOR-3 bacterium]
MLQKTLGPTGAQLITSLYNIGKTIFDVRDVEKLTGLRGNSATDLASRLIKRNIIARIKPGKYVIIPQEIGDSTNYIGNWYVIAREIVNSRDYYVSHYSAMDLHNMVTHPVTTVYITTPKREYSKRRFVGNTVYEFIYTNKQRIWGVTEIWVTRSEKVRVSDIEKTIVDCLYRPEYCGGIIEITKGLWIQRGSIDFEKLRNYTLKFGKYVIIKRLGYILENLNVVDSNYLRELRIEINDEYYILDPLLSTEERYKNSWKIVANIGPKEIVNSVTT